MGPGIILRRLAKMILLDIVIAVKKILGYDLCGHL